MKRDQLTALKVQKLSSPGHYADGMGLYLQVSESGTKSWVFRYRGIKQNGKVGSREMGLGPVGTLTLKDAREKAREYRKLVLDGIDPIDARKAKRDKARAEAAKRVTFARCVEEYLTGAHAKKWTNDRHRRQWVETLARANKAFGSLPVGAIDTGTVVAFLKPIWAETPTTAQRLLGRIERVLGYAIACGYREDPNPARWTHHLSEIFARVDEKAHHAAMAFTEVPRFMAELRERDLISARALEFCILTAARTGEVIRARWDEIAGDVWTLPASRTKSGKEHKVPLSRRAAELLDDLRSHRDGDYVFPGLRPSAPLNVVAMLELLRRMKGDGLTVHGFRSAFKDWAHERTSYPDEISEFALAHGIPDKTKAAYRRYTALDKRRRLMQAWADYCSAPVIEGKVVSLHGAA